MEKERNSDIRFIVRQSHLNHLPLLVFWFCFTALAIYLTYTLPWALLEIGKIGDVTIKLPLFALPSLILLAMLIHMVYDKKMIFTDDYILFLDGIMSWKEKSIRLHYFNIKEIEIDQTIYQRIFGLGDLLITTVATQVESSICMPGIRKARVVKDYINKRVFESTSRSSTAEKD